MGEQVTKSIQLCVAVSLVLTFFISGFAPEVFAIQTGLPDEDIASSCAGWSKADSFHYLEVDDLVGAADVDDTFIATTTDAATCEVGIAEPTEPDSSTGHIIHFRAQATGSKAGEQVEVFIFEGGTQKAASGNIGVTRGSFNDYSYTLDTTETDSLIYSDMRIKIEIAKLGGGETIEVSQMYLEVPDAALGPTVSIFSPSDGDNTNDNTPLIEVSASAPAGVDTVTVSIDGGTDNPAALNVDTGRYEFTPTTLSDGDHDITATVTDLAAASDTTAITTITVDIVAPTVSIFSPSDGATISDNTPLIEVTASDGTSGIDTVTVSIDSGSDNPATLNEGTGRYEFTPITLAPGVHTITATATDLATNSDTTSPAITITLVASAVQENSPDAPGISCEEWTVIGGGAHWEALDDPVGTPDDTTFIDSGTAAAFCEVAITEPDDPVSSVEHIIHFRAQATGAKASEKLQVFLFEGTTQKAASDVINIARGSYADYSYTLDTTETDSLIYSDMRIRIQIASINNGDSLQVTQMYLEAPAAASGPTVSIFSPSDGDNTNDNTPLIEVTASAPAGIASVTVSIDGGTDNPAEQNGGTGRYEFTPTALIDGIHTITATATDSDTNSDTTAIPTSTV